MIKITVDETGAIIKAEPVATKEMILDWDMGEGVVFENGQYVKLADATTLPDTEITRTIQKAKELEKEKNIKKKK